MLAPLFAQMHKVAAPEEIVRAVGVYEWTGDRTKPAASRLIPVTIFIDGTLQDAGEYLARPVPLALDSGTVYEVDQAGVPEGTLDMLYASHLQSPDGSNTYDDGWFGYGRFLPPPAPKKVVALKESKQPTAIVGVADPDSDRPTLIRRHPSGGDASPSAPASSSAGTASPAPPEDPDRPHLSKRADTTGSTASPTPDQTASTAPAASDGGTDKTANSTGAGSTPAADPDRPTLKKRSPEEAKKARREAEQSSAYGLATSLNDDPNRPTLHRGNSGGKGQQALTEADLPKLKGIPVGLHQAVAISDAKNRPPHDFSRPWADDAERAEILAKMQALAREQLAAYKGAAATATAAPAPSAPAARPASTSRTTASKPRRAKPAAPPPPQPLEDEQLTGYTLSYGGDATYVYMAHTPGDGSDRRYVTVVAQMDGFGQLKPAIQSVTDAAHLDRTPWMRLVDVVDVEASNRASLLFELRGQTARQFAVYRVIAARADQIFLSGTTQ
jgi:hypothetical protein